MPLSGPRAALLLLPPLLLLHAILAVPLEREVTKESPATESPVSGPVPLPSQVLAGGRQSRGPTAPGGYFPDAHGVEFAGHSL